MSATFAASMVISPALGDYTRQNYGDNVAVALATAIAILDVFFILVAVPESLPEKARPTGPISWEQADPFAALGKVCLDNIFKTNFLFQFVYNFFFFYYYRWEKITQF